MKHVVKKKRREKNKVRDKGTWPCQLFQVYITFFPNMHPIKRPIDKAIDMSIKTIFLPIEVTWNLGGVFYSHL